MNEKQIIKTLKKFRPKPNEYWVDETINELINVTNLSLTRNSITTLYKFNYSNNMSGALIALIAGIVAILGVGGTVVASDSANPGDFLYPVDTLVENVQRSLITNPVKETELELKLLDERVEELKNLSEDGDLADITLATEKIVQERTRLQELLQLMTQLREKGELQGEDQLKVMEKLQEAVKKQTETINEVQKNLDEKGNSDDDDASESVNELESGYADDLNDDIADFEDSTGIEVEEHESNEGEDSEIKNQNEVKNEGDDSGNDDDEEDEDEAEDEEDEDDSNGRS